MYVLKRTDGYFVAKEGCRNSYTKFLQKARIFQYKESAQANRCIENEYIVSLDEIIY